MARHAGGFERCRLTPKGGRDAIDGFAILSDGSRVLLARVRRAPEDGRANEAPSGRIAALLGMPISAARLSAGARSRVKQVSVAGDLTAARGDIHSVLTPAKRLQLGTGFAFTICS